MRKTVFITIGLMLAHEVYAQSPWDTVWTYTEHHTNYERLRRLAIDRQGNVVVTGRTDEVSYGDDLLVIKLDSSGNLQWKRIFDGPFDNSDEGISVTVDSTGNYVVVGATASFSVSSSVDIWVMKFDAQTGDTLWSLVIEWSEWDAPIDILTLPNGTLAITGYTYSFDYYTSDVLLMKMDPYSGDTTLVIVYPGSEYWEKGIAIASDNDGYLLIGGDIRDSNYAYDGLLMKVDTSGNLIWQTTPGGAGNDYIRDVMVDDNGDYVFVGHTDSYSDSFDVWIGKVRASDGSIIWSRALGSQHNEFAYSIFQDGEGRYIVSGYTTSPTYPGTDMLIYMLNPQDGSVIDSTVMHFEANDVIMDGGQSPDGSYVFAGYYSSRADILVIKTLGTRASVSTEESSSGAYLRHIPGGIAAERDMRVEVYTPSGKKIAERIMMRGEVLHLRPGLYLLRLVSDENIHMEKVLIR